MTFPTFPPPPSLPQNWLRFANNKFSGSVPESLAATAPHLSQLTLDNNDFEVGMGRPV